MRHSQDHTDRGKPVTLYIPSPLRVALPKVTVISLLLIAAANIGSLIKTDDWSAISFKIHLLTTFIIISLFGLILLIVYYGSKMLSPFLVIDHDSLIIVKLGKAREYNLDDINSFAFDISTSDPKNYNRIDIALFINTVHNEKLCILAINHPYRILDAWKEMVTMLEDLTHKSVITVFHVQDDSG
jgi:hypothetical protein